MAEEKFDMITSAARINGAVLAVCANDDAVFNTRVHVFIAPACWGSKGNCFF